MPFKAILEQVTINRLPGSGPLANGDDHLAICERHASPAYNPGSLVCK